MDTERLKNTVIEHWSQFGPNTLVKVMPIGRKPAVSIPVGYCSSVKYVAGRTPAAIENIMGFRLGSKLAAGAEIYVVWPLPTSDQFDLRGYTHTPEGIPTDKKVPHPDYPPGLGAPQWDLARVEQAKHLKWLSTVLPGQEFRCNLASLTQNAMASMR